MKSCDKKLMVYLDEKSWQTVDEISEKFCIKKSAAVRFIIQQYKKSTEGKT